MIWCRWFAKRFLHPDIVAEYDYIFLWDEDLDVEHFNPGRYANYINCGFCYFDATMLQDGYCLVLLNLRILEYITLYFLEITHLSLPY